MGLQYCRCLRAKLDVPGKLRHHRKNFGSRSRPKVDDAKLLEDRFKLKVHRETKQSPVGVLVVAKSGIKNLQPIDHPGPFPMKRVDGKLEIRNGSMSNVAEVLGSPLGNMPLEKTVDQTGLSGVSDVTLDLRNFDPKDPEFAGKYL